MTRRDLILKLLAYGITLVLCAIFNYFVFPLTPLPVPLLLPVCTVAAGCLEGGQFGAGFGVASGLLLATLGHGGWGYVALLAFVGWVSGLLGQYVLRQDLWGHVIAAGGVGGGAAAGRGHLHLRPPGGAALPGSRGRAVLPGVCIPCIRNEPFLLRPLRSNLSRIRFDQGFLSPIRKDIS